MVFPAHIVKRKNKKRVQTVRQHCLKTAQYAKSSLESQGLGNTAYLAGLLHDFGKYTLKYKQYIEDSYDGKKVRRGSVNHTFAAVIYLFEKYHKQESSKLEKTTCEIISYAVGAHHGLFDGVGPDGESGFVHRVEKDKKEICYDEAYKNYIETCISEEEIDDLFQKAVDEVGIYIEKIRNCVKPEGNTERTGRENATENLFFLIGLLGRLVLSAVINGDRRDTAEFFQGKEFLYTCANKNIWRQQIEYLEQKINFKADTPINQARAYISDRCASFVSDKGGIYRITVPTGAGKTISMLRFALAQAEHHNKKRIIFIIPLLSVLDQNSEVIKTYIESSGMIFEHHSNIVKTMEDDDELDRYELLSETWESPIIISTLVQLLNTLFSAKTSSVRRMQSLSDSVIVIDEAQSVPKKLTYMFNMAMNFLAYCANADIVLSSATQPAFDSVEKALHFSRTADIVPYSGELWKAFERTDIIHRNDLIFEDEEELGRYAARPSAKEKTLLCICNTKRNAAKLYESVKKKTEVQVFHLSTAMCMAHRRKILGDILNRQKDGEPMICISTQLVEAGVDFSFERVLRMEAGLDNIAQAAGRCNRNGEGAKKGKVEIVKLKNENITMLKEIAISQTCFRRFVADFEKDMANYENILTPKSVNRYFELLFHELEAELSYPLKVDLTDTSLFEMLAQNRSFGSKNKNYCINQAFKTAGSYFKVFDEDTFDVIVPYDETAEHIIGEIVACDSFEFERLKKLLEQAKLYTVQIYGYQKEKLEEYGMIYRDKAQRIMMLNKNAYSPETGLKEDVKQISLIY